MPVVTTQVPGSVCSVTWSISWSRKASVRRLCAIENRNKRIVDAKSAAGKAIVRYRLRVGRGYLLQFMARGMNET